MQVEPQQEKLIETGYLHPEAAQVLAAYQRITSRPTNNIVGDQMVQGAIDLVEADLIDLQLTEAIGWAPLQAAAEHSDRSTVTAGALIESSPAAISQKSGEHSNRSTSLQLSAVGGFSSGEHAEPTDKRLERIRKLLRHSNKQTAIDPSSE